MSNRFSAGPVDLTTTDAALAVIDANVDAVLVDTGTTIPGTIATVDTVVDSISAAQVFPFTNVAKETATIIFNAGVYAEIRDWVVGGNFSTLTVQVTFTIKSDGGSLVTPRIDKNGTSWLGTFGATVSTVPIVVSASGTIEPDDVIELWGVTAGGSIGIINMFSIFVDVLFES